MTQAFILGAGLGTRLQPLTHRLPKPLVPLFHRPLADWILDSCRAAGIRRFAVNTHHLPQAWSQFLEPATDLPPVHGLNGLPASSKVWHGDPVHLFHEPILLETGGGLKNITPWIANEPLLVHNGDIFSSLPLDRLIAAHAASGLPVTLALRSEGAQKRVAVDATGTRILDLRGILGRGTPSHVFTGIYCINPQFLERLNPGKVEQVIPAFVELAATGQLGAVIIDEGDWLDLGDRESYLAAHRTLDLAPAIHPTAMIDPQATVEHSVIGPAAIIEAGAIVKNSIVWPGGRVATGADVDGCILYSADPATGNHRHADL